MTAATAVSRRRVQAPAPRVVEVLEDGWSISSWLAGSAAVEAVDGSWPEAGSSLRQSLGAWPLLVSGVLQVESADERGAIRMRSQVGPAATRVDVAARPEGPRACWVVLRESLLAPAALSSSRLVLLALRLHNDESLRRLARLAEQPAPSDR